jgi:hypothetical protein
MSLEADYKRKRREQSTDFKLYQAANVRASRARKEAAEAKAELAKVTAWPLHDGYRAARAGKVFDRTQSADWQRGYRLGQRK